MPRTAHGQNRGDPDRVSLPRRGGPPLRVAARLVDEVCLDGTRARMCLRLWHTNTGRFAAEATVRDGGTVLADAVVGDSLAEIADWLENLDPWPPAGQPVRGDAPAAGVPGLGASAIWAAALRCQDVADFRWLVGEALFRWHGQPAPAKRKKENAA